MEHNTTTECKIQSRSLLVSQGVVHYSFDRSGRFLFRTRPGQAVRRGLDHRMVESTQDPGRREERQYRDLSPSEKERILAEAYAAARTCLRQLTDRQSNSHAEQDWLSKVLEWQTKDLARDEQAFRATYLPISILPPDQYHALVVQVTEGCSYNRCLFCDFYRDRPFKIKSDEELSHHLMNIRNFFGERLLDMHEVFLGDGNALVVPTQQLVNMLSMIRHELGERFSSISTFVDTFTLDKKDGADLLRLHEAGLNTAYIGFETGLPELRRTLKKPGDTEEAVNAVRLLKEAGWRVAIILLIQIGDLDLARRHLSATVDALSGLALDKRDLIYLSPFVEPANSPYLASSPELKLHLMFGDARDMQQEFQLWKNALAGIHQEVKISLYPIRQHLY